jgi:hypothetical protein
VSTVSCAIDKSYLLDVFTKLYIATDSNPVDSHTYELCSDLVDVVIDVSCIYGLSMEEGTTIPYDYDSSSAVKLNNGLVRLVNFSHVLLVTLLLPLPLLLPPLYHQHYFNYYHSCPSDCSSTTTLLLPLLLLGFCYVFCKIKLQLK